MNLKQQTWHEYEIKWWKEKFNVLPFDRFARCVLSRVFTKRVVKGKRWKFRTDTLHIPRSLSVKTWEKCWLIPDWETNSNEHFFQLIQDLLPPSFIMVDFLFSFPTCKGMQRNFSISFANMGLWKMDVLNVLLCALYCGETGWCLVECKQLGGNWRSLKFSVARKKFSESRSSFHWIKWW